MTVPDAIDPPTPAPGRTPAVGPIFLGASALPVTSSAPTTLLLGVGAALTVVVALGPMAAQLGSVSIWVWAATAAIGLLQCILLGELTARFPERAGGTAQFAYRAFPNGSASLGALSAWCYWFAWTPGIAVDLLLAGDYLRALVWPGANPVLLAAAMAVGLYVVTTMGLRTSAALGAILMTVGVGVVVAVLAAPAMHPHTFDPAHITPRFPVATVRRHWSQFPLVVLKWGFVASWSSYAGEMASAACSETRRPERTMARTMTMSGVVCLAICTLIPAVLFGVVGAHGVAGDPLQAFAAIGRIVDGPIGARAVGLALVAVLVLGAEAFVVGSSRTIYQLARDGQLPPCFAAVNRRGAPIGSIALDATVIGIMLTVFGTHVVDLVAAANVGYLIVFVLLPLAYLVLRHNAQGAMGAPRLGRWAVPAAGFLVAVNLALLALGGAQWGRGVMGVGMAVSLAILPVAAACRRASPAEAERG